MSGEEIKKNVEKANEEVGHAPEYVTSDNASGIGKGVRDSGCVRVRDVAHTFGTFAEHVYGKDEEFDEFVKKVTLVKFREVMTSNARLPPPKRRSIARFMNSSKISDWAFDVSESYFRLPPGERRAFSFVPRSASLVDELKETFDCLNAIQKDVKEYGISKRTADRNAPYINRLRRAGSRPARIADDVAKYIREESAKAGEKCWNASSDVIESLFGVYKMRKCPNPLVGVTPFVFLLPLHTRIHRDENGNSRPVDFKKSFENVRLSDIENWKKENLLENMVAKRIKFFKSA